MPRPEWSCFLLLAWHSGRPTATLYGEPEDGTYRVLETVEYGRELTLPEPFGLVLDTGVFPSADTRDGPPHGEGPCGGPPSCLG